MSSIEVRDEAVTEPSVVATSDMHLQAVVVPVADADSAKQCCQSLGLRLDVDYVGGPDFRVVRFTPPPVGLAAWTALRRKRTEPLGAGTDSDRHLSATASVSRKERARLEPRRDTRHAQETHHR